MEYKPEIILCTDKVNIETGFCRSICHDETAGTITVELYNEIFDYVELTLDVNDPEIQYWEMFEDFVSLTIRLKSENVLLDILITDFGIE